MDRILMCKNQPVYNVDKGIILNFNFLPGVMQRFSSVFMYKTWLELRYSSNTNGFARKLKEENFGSSNRRIINKVTHALSLSDCYWLKEEDENVLFEEITPYCNDFWKGVGCYNNQSIPTLYLNGYLGKEWVSSEYFYKYGSNVDIEVECYKLCLACEIPCVEIIFVKSGCVAYKNITNMNVMLESADMNGLDEKDILKIFGLRGLQMLVIDGIIGNGDRHKGNFGWLRNANTGEYITMALLYDFDHALNSTKDSDFLIAELIMSIRNNDLYKYEALRIANIVVNIDTNEIFKRRAKTIIKFLGR